MLNFNETALNGGYIASHHVVLCQNGYYTVQVVKEMYSWDKEDLCQRALWSIRHYARSQTSIAILR
jgi:hypothetical protein